MKTTILIALLFVFAPAISQEDFTLHLKDTSIKVSLNKHYEMKINGKTVPFYLTGNDTLTYEDDFISFKYTRDFNISNSVIEEGLEQLMIMSAEGSGILIQKHGTLNPSKLNEIMLDEITKESLNYGYVMTREDYKLKLNSGKQIEVNKAVLKYKESINIYEITSFGGKDEGALIITIRMDELKESKGKELIDLMWKTLDIK